MNFWESLDAYPPLVVRLCARRSKGGKNVVALTNQEIAIETGIPLIRINEISQLLSWEYMTISEARRFCQACRFDPTMASDRKKQAIYTRVCQIKRPNQPPQYLRNSPLWTTYFLPLIQRLKSFNASSTG